MKLKPLIERHPLTTYFILAFGISWGGVLLVLWTQGFPILTASFEQGIAWYCAMLVGPSLTGILLTAILEGKKGLKDFFARLFPRNVGLHWYAVSIFTNPLVVLASHFALALLVSPVYQPVFASTRMILGLGAGIFEEIGWTGFVTPRIAHRPKWLSIAIGFGILHGLWHLPVDFMGNWVTSGWYWLFNYLVFWIGAVAAYRVLMVWVYQHTGSLMLGILMHTVFTGSFLVFRPALSPAELLIWGAVYTASLWVIVSILAAGKLIQIRGDKIEIRKNISVILRNPGRRGAG